MAISRLIGSDGELWAYTFAAPLVTGTATKGAEYKIVKMDGATVFPDGYKIGDLYTAAGTETFSATNSAALATAAIIGDITSFKFTFSKDAVEVTVLADAQKHYRAAKSDVTGTIEGITFVDKLADGSAVANRFLRIANIAANGSITLNKVDNSDLFIKGFLQKDDADGETQVWVSAQVELLGYDFGAATSDAQAWSSDARLLTDMLLYTKVTQTT